MAKFLVVSGADRVDISDATGTVSEILESQGIERHDGEYIICGDAQVGDDYTPEDGQTLVYVPPVGLGNST